MEAESRRILVEGGRIFGVRLDDQAVAAFDLFLRELLKWNRKINLTAIGNEEGIITKHFLDSLSLCPYLPRSISVLDIGSGAGFPGIPLKIVNSSLEVTLTDSVAKKIDFQRHLIRTLGLRGIEAVHSRVEDRGMLPRFENRFDYVVSRAFSDLSTFLTLSHSFLKAKGIALAMKGGLKEEMADLFEKGKVRYRLKETVAFILPFTSLKRTVLLFEKQ